MWAVWRMVPVEVQLLGRARAGEAAQTSQGNAHVAHAELDRVVEILEFALVPHLDRAEIAVAVLADADALGIVAIGAVGRGPGGADPFRAALVAAPLLLEALLQGLQELVPAQGLDLLLLLLAEIFLRQLAQPFLGNLGVLDGLGQTLQALEDMAEHPVELVQVALVLHQAGAGEIIELLDVLFREVAVERIEQGQVFAQGHGHLGVAQFREKIEQHAG